MQCCKVILIIVLVVSISGCAAILNQSRTSVSFNSDPPGAMVYIDGMPSGKTPMRLELSNKHDYMIQIKKEGYTPCGQTISRSVGAGWVIADVILTGLLGVIIDVATDSWSGLDEGHVNCYLERMTGNNNENSNPTP